MTTIHRAILLVVLVGLSRSAAVVNAAPILNPDNGHYYEFIPDRVTWPVAKAAAEAMTFMGAQGHLVDIHDASENMFVRNLIAGNPQNAAWIGLNDIAVEGVFEWTTGAPLTYTNWAPGEPNNAAGGEDFVHMIADFNPPTFGRWNDFRDQNIIGYLVEFEPVPVPEPASVAVWTLLGLAGFGYRHSRRGGASSSAQ